MATELISLGIFFFCAIVGGIIATKFKQPAVFGLLLVGAVIGPSALNIVQDLDMITLLADFGAIIILFIIGLEFDISKLMKLGARSIIIGLLKFAIVLFLGFEATLLLGFDVKTALFMGVILSFSSTVVVVKVLQQKEMFSRKEVPLLIAMLIIEDILAVFALTYFSGINGASNGMIDVFEHVIFSLTILVIAYYLILKTIKYVINIILKNNSDESVLSFLSLGMGTAFSYFAYWLGLTPSAGAFLAGSLIASLPNAKEYGKAIHPYALIFTAIFFMSMGTLVDFSIIKSNLPFIGVLILTIFISRFIAVGFLTYLLANFKNEQPFFSSIAMISVGEFSLLVAKESQKFGVGIDLVTITAAIIFITAIIMSIGINYSEKVHYSLNSIMPMATRLRLERISNYMRRFFDQMEIENFFTKKLRHDAKMISLFSFLALFAMILLRRGAILIKSSFHTLALYGYYVAAAIIAFYMLSLVYKKARNAHHTLSVILTNVDSSRNLKKCNMILNYLAISFILLFLAMMFPFAIFMFEFGMWANTIPFFLAILAIYFVKNLVALIDGPGHTIPRYSTGLSFAKF